MNSRYTKLKLAVWNFQLYFQTCMYALYVWEDGNENILNDAHSYAFHRNVEADLSVNITSFEKKVLWDYI